MKKILVTGAAGKVGKIVSQALKEKNYILTLADLQQMPAVDILDFENLKKAMQAVDCVIHLAGIPQDAAWDKLETINIHGTYNVFEAARQQKVPRVIFASTNHVIGFYRVEQTIDDKVYPKPASYYGVTKVFGEALAQLYANKFGMSVACLRIGSFEEKPREIRQLSTWISHRDLIQLVIRCIEAEYHFIIVYGVSANTRSKWENPAAKEIGYVPQDNAEDFANDPTLTEKRDKIGKQFQGGQFCSADFSGDPSKID
jgi:uronate dehydrogenase